MVSETTRNKIILFLTVICLVLIAFLVVNKFKNYNYYLATDNKTDLAVLDGIFKLKNRQIDQNTSGKNKIKAVIVPHHLVASEAIALGISSLVNFNPKTIVVISPDHFGKCQTFLCTSQTSYKTYFGIVDVDKKSVNNILTNKLNTSTSDLFSEEHGIFSIMPYIKYYLPKATVVPLVISQKGIGSKTVRSEIIAIIDNLIKDQNTALVVSSDFSHYLTLDRSNMEDLKTQSTFLSGDDDGILYLNNADQSDCPVCLWVMRQQAKNHNFWKPEIIWHSNSADILMDKTVKQTTSHFVITFNLEN